MEYILDKDKEMLIVLSTIFVDNEIDYEYIKRDLAKYEIIDIENFFFNYIIPICANTLGTPVPYVTYYFDDEFLFENFLKIQKKNKNTLLQKIKNKYIRWKFAKIWEELKKNLINK